MMKVSGIWEDVHKERQDKPFQTAMQEQERQSGPQSRAATKPKPGVRGYD